MSYRFFNIIALLSLCAVNISAHTGKVFVDANANGRFDKGEKLLKGVVVSDGLNVVKTASDGTYVLPGHERERFIFITTPSGYKTMNRYYHRIGEGTDFGLIPYNPGIGKNGEHHFIQITDTEIFNTSNQEDWISNIRDYASNQKSAFVIHTGDICYEKGLREHIKLMNTENMNVPVYYCIGNHDLVKGKYGEELFESIYGPVYYSFDVAGVHYVVTPMSGGDHKPGYTSDDVCNWLKNDLSQVADGTPVVVFNHDLLTTSNDFVFKGESGSQLNLNDYNLRAWIYGHWHINYRRQQGDVTTICTSTLDKGGIDHSKSAYRVVGIDNDGKVSTELRYTYQDRHMVIASPQGVSATSFLTVNAYSSVSPVKQMTYVCLIGNKTVVSTQPLRQLTDWTWGADMLLDERLIGKELTVRVTATFNNGQKVEADSRFVYDPSSEIKIGKNWTNLVGNASHSALADTIGDDMHLAWVKNIGANIYMSSPLVYDGKVYVASVDEDHKGDAAIFALDGNTGNILWKYPVKNSIKNTIAITDGNVFAQDAEGNLYAVDAVSGQLKWQKRLDVKGIPAIVEGLAAENGIVYAGAGMGMAAFDAHTGKRLWQNDSWQQGEGTTSTISVGDGILAMGAQWSALYGNDASTGELKWSHSEYGLR
ncbi:MAG: PQQ-binding-like beta-propeller repeat protein, partial [Paramuribaculum sp.]|nr:PQQ-binding-like beta-propeller repeat protein [Paramuribaculum sp.]